MEQMSAKLASLVPPPQPRGELLVEKLGAEKVRETGEARRRPLDRSTVEVKGAGGGILVIGGLLAAAAVAAGATIIARRAQAKRPPAIKNERVDGFNGDHKSEQSQIDGSVGIPEDNHVSVKSKDNWFEDDTCNGAEELLNGIVLDVDQVHEKICREVDLALQNGIGEEIRLNDQCQKGELREEVENILEKPWSDVADETPGEEENEVASPGEAEHNSVVNHRETEPNEYVPPALGNEEKSDVSRAAGPSIFKEMVEQQIVEASQSDLAEEATSQDISEQQTEQISDEYKREKEDNLEKHEEEIEEKKVPESSPEAAAEEEMKEKKEAEPSPQHEEGEEENEDKKENKSSPEPEGEEIEEKKEAETSPEGKEHEEEKKDIDTPHEGEEKDEHEEVTEEKKELESSLEGEGDETHSNQTQPRIIHSEVGTEEFSTTKETDEAIEKRRPASFAQEEDGSKNNQIQTNIADPQHRAEEQSTVNEVEKKGEERQESDSSPEEAAQMRGDVSGSARVSSAKLNEAAITPSEVVEQAEIPLHEVESKILSDSLITSGEVKDEVHVNEAEEKQEDLVHANKVEENTENVVQQHFMAIIREKALVLEKFLMDIPDRLLMGFLVMALTIVLLHHTKLLSRLYHMISPSEENLQEN